MSQAPSVDAAGSVEGPVNNLGARLREVRLREGLSLREVARRLGVSPSFISQMENGKSQPSVATLYSMAQLLGVSIDQLFERGIPGSEGGLSMSTSTGSRSDVHEPFDPIHVGGLPPSAPSGDSDPEELLNRSNFSSPGDVWDNSGPAERIQIIRPTDRPRLVMDSGVVWEQLAVSQNRDVDFMEIIYPAGSSSTNDGRMLRHVGVEYGYLLSGNLQITYGFDTYTLNPGESLTLDSSIPHLFTNPGNVPARGLWVVHHCTPESPARD